jgi:hypothetical protein
VCARCLVGAARDLGRTYLERPIRGLRAPDGRKTPLLSRGIERFVGLVFGSSFVGELAILKGAVSIRIRAATQDVSAVEDARRLGASWWWGEIPGTSGVIAHKKTTLRFSLSLLDRHAWCCQEQAWAVRIPAKIPAGDFIWRKIALLAAGCFPSCLTFSLPGVQGMCSYARRTLEPPLFGHQLTNIAELAQILA